MMVMAIGSMGVPVCDLFVGGGANGVDLDIENKLLTCTRVICVERHRVEVYGCDSDNFTVGSMEQVTHFDIALGELVFFDIHNIAKIAFAICVLWFDLDTAFVAGFHGHENALKTWNNLTCAGHEREGFSRFRLFEDLSVHVG
jgi:hypothetical protein